MKKLFLLGQVVCLIALLAIIVSCQEPLKLPKVSQQIKDDLSIVYDKFQDSYLIKAIPLLLSTNFNRPRLELWIEYGQKGKKLLAVMSYTGISMMDFTYGVIFVKDERYETPHYTFLSPNVRHEAIEGGISELIKMSYMDRGMGQIIIWIWAAKESDTIEYRFYGSRDYMTSKMTPQEIKAWASIYDYYTAIDAAPLL